MSELYVWVHYQHQHSKDYFERTGNHCEPLAALYTTSVDRLVVAFVCLGMSADTAHVQH